MTVCYRHPSNEAYVRCQRCERFICPQCQVEAPVGFLCPEDAGRTAAAAAAGVADSAVHSAKVAVYRTVHTAFPITWALIAINVLVWGFELLDSNVVNTALYSPIYTFTEPWRIFTSGFAHDRDTPLHIFFNMYSLFVLGRVVEPMFGKIRFLALYLFSMVAGTFAFMAFGDFASSVVGASGAIFGLMGAYFVILRTYGAQLGQIGTIIAINLVFGFIVPGVAWQAHLGGLAGGVLIAFIYSKTRLANQRALQAALVIASAAVLTVAFFVVGNDRIHAFFYGG